MFCNVVYLDRTPDVSSTQPRKNRFRIVKTGIIGTGRITLRFVGEAKFVSGTNIICAYNLEKESAQAFSRKYRLRCCTFLGKAFTEAETVGVYQLAREREKRYDLMEGIKAAYCPVFQQSINVAKSGKIGEMSRGNLTVDFNAKKHMGVVPYSARKLSVQLSDTLC